MKPTTRREFLEQSLIAATVAATAGALPQNAWAGEKRRVDRVIGSNDRIRVAVIGVNGRGKDHVSSFNRMPDVDVATLCDIDTRVFAPAAKIITDSGKPAPKLVQDLRRVMDDPEIDAVSIATCNHWHSLAAIWAMQAGKDVYVEKPVSHNVREGRVMVDTARKYRRICQAGTQIRSQQGTRDAIAFIHDGKIGKVEVARALCYKLRKSIGQMQPGPVPEGVDYNLWLGPAPHRPWQQNTFHYNWHWRWDTGNGDLGNQGIHQMDVARWGLNKSEFPKSVLSFGGRLGYVDDGETPNTQVVALDYDDAQLIFEVRGLPTKDYRGATVGNVFHGTDGYVVMTGYASGAAFDRDGKLITTFTGGGDHYRNFIDCMRSRKVEDLRGEIEEGHISSALCHLGNVSYRLGEPQSLTGTPEAVSGDEALAETLERTVQHLGENGVDTKTGTYRMGRKLKVNAERENFGKNREANAQLTRHYRDPFAVPKKA
jgi:predicted dehydrogenase